jgi:hypothetical protein
MALGGGRCGSASWARWRCGTRPGSSCELGGPRLRALLIRLALDPGRPVASDRLAGDLWAGDGPERAGPADSGNALQALVSRLRHAAGPGIRMLLPNTSGIMKMNAIPCTVSGDGATSPMSTEIQQTARKNT